MQFKTTKEMYDTALKEFSYQYPHWPKRRMDCMQPECVAMRTRVAAAKVVERKGGKVVDDDIFPTCAKGMTTADGEDINVDEWSGTADIATESDNHTDNAKPDEVAFVKTTDTKKPSATQKVGGRRVKNGKKAKSAGKKKSLPNPKQKVYDDAMLRIKLVHTTNALTPFRQQMQQMSKHFEALGLFKDMDKDGADEEDEEVEEEVPELGYGTKQPEMGKVN